MKKLEDNSIGKCLACNGTGIQVNKDGLKVLCPVCSGLGRLNVLTKKSWDGAINYIQ